MRFASREAQRISIHALREESDLGSAHVSIFPQIFQSTLSVRRATDWDVDGE